MNIYLVLLGLLTLPIFIWYFRSRNDSVLRIDVGTCSYILFSSCERAVRHKIQPLTFDMFRDRYFIKNDNRGWDERSVKINFFLKLSWLMLQQKDILVITSANTEPSFSPFILMSKIFGYKLKVLDMRTTREKALEEVKKMSDIDILKVTPFYFQYHHHLFQDIPGGAERGRAVLMYELERYSQEKFLPFPLAIDIKHMYAPKLSG